MKIHPLHTWALDREEALAVQKRLSTRIIQKNGIGQVRYLAGADLAFSRNPARAFATVLILDYPDLRVVEEQIVRQPVSFPYIPGLLAFREAPALLKAFEQLRHDPDLVIIDGQGLAHPRGFGIACHIGLWLNKPTIGCAKSHLFGDYRMPPSHRGAWTPVTGKRNQVIGAVLRTKDRTNPVHVSVGHRLDLETAVQWILACGRGYRIPEPTRQAHIFVGRSKTLAHNIT